MDFLPKSRESAAIPAILLAFAASATAQPQVAPLIGIFGRVVNVETHEPVRRAAVKVYTAKDQWDEITDAEGRFRFPRLVKGEYTLIAHRDGYTDRAYKVELSDFDAQVELPIELRPQGLILGKIVDALGQPLENATVEALGSRTRGAAPVVLGTTQTNDLGECRLSDLDPGNYQLRARYQERGDPEGFDPTPLTVATAYFGNSEKPADIAVKAGSVTSGIDFILTPVRPATVRGTLHTGAGPLTERATLWIMGKSGEGGHNGNSQDGKFQVDDLGPGTYSISAQTPSKAAPMFGSVEVKVGAVDIDNVDIVLRPVPKIEGEIVMEGAPSNAKPGSVYFNRTERLTALSMEIGKPASDGRFSVNLVPGVYRLSLDAFISALGIRSVMLDGEPVTNWTIRIDESVMTRKLVIVVGGGQQ
jgi:hypothetical protein